MVFPSPFGHRHSLLGHPVPARELSPPHGRLTGRMAGPRRGYRVPHARATTGVGAPYTPRTAVLIPDRADCPAGACRSTTASPSTPLQHPTLRGSALRGINEGSSNSPVQSSPRPRPPGWNGPPLGLSPELRTPPTKSRTTHVEVGTGHRARTWNYTLNSHQSISNPVVHSMRATSRRTSEGSSPGEASEAAALVLATQVFVADSGERPSDRRCRSAAFGHWGQAIPTIWRGCSVATRSLRAGWRLGRSSGPRRQALEIGRRRACAPPRRNGDSHAAAQSVVCRRE